MSNSLYVVGFSGSRGPNDRLLSWGGFNHPHTGGSREKNSKSEASGASDHACRRRESQRVAFGGIAGKRGDDDANPASGGDLSGKRLVRSLLRDLSNGGAPQTAVELLQLSLELAGVQRQS